MTAISLMADELNVNVKKDQEKLDETSKNVENAEVSIVAGTQDLAVVRRSNMLPMLK